MSDLTVIEDSRNLGRHRVKKDSRVVCESYTIILEDLEHNTNVLHLFMEKLWLS